MANESPSSTILATKTQELLEARNNELNRVLKLKLVVEQLRDLKMEPEQNPEIERALKILSIGDYMRLGDGEEYVLDLQEYSNCPSLSYTNRKALISKLSAHLRGTLNPIVELGDKIRLELPEVFAKELQLTAGQQDIIHLQKEYRDCLKKQVELLNRKCRLLQTAAELKTGPHLTNELKLEQTQAQLVQTKSELMRAFFINEIVTSAEHSVKAHKEVDQYMDELLSLKN